MQKFHHGDWVHVAEDSGSGAKQSQTDCDAIVIGSYADQYGGDDHTNYTLYWRKRAEVSWYEERQLTLIEYYRPDILHQWQDEIAAENREKGDLNWIFSHGQDVLAAPQSASIQALASCLDIDDLWGDEGEGITYVRNAGLILQAAFKFLRNNDKAGWLAYCEQLKAQLAAAEGS